MWNLNDVSLGLEFLNWSNYFVLLCSSLSVARTIILWEEATQWSCGGGEAGPQRNQCHYIFGSLLLSADMTLKLANKCIYCNVHIQICRYVFIALEICVITHKVICTCIMFIICVRICYLMFYTALFRYIIRYMFQLFSTSNYIMKSLFPLEDVQLLEKAVAGLERSVEKDFQALPCNSLDYTRRDQGDVSFFR